MKRVVNVLLTVALVALAGYIGWIVLSRFGVTPPPPQSSVVPTKKPSKKNRGAYAPQDDESIKATDIGPRKWKIIDIHEHAKSEVEAQQLLNQMDKLGVQRTALMSSTTYTLTLNPKYGFEGFKENGEAIIAIKKKWPDRFSAFITFDPCDGSDNLAYVKDAVARGADGVKLYLGHGATTPRFAFHCEPINHENLEPFFAWAEEVQLPILLHVNLEKYWDEILDVFERHPYVRVTMPHFGLHKNSGPRLQRLGFLLERYPNVYTDVSFGHHTFQIEGFEALSNARERSREFLTKYRHKIQYASDMVLEPSKDEPYIQETMRSYMQFLEMERWRFNLVPDFTMYGMGLDDETLRHIYEVAPKNFLLLDDKGMSPDRSKDPKVVVPRHPIPPLAVHMIPSLPGKLSIMPPRGPVSGIPNKGTTSGSGNEDGQSAEQPPSGDGAGCEHESEVD